MKWLILPLACLAVLPALADPPEVVAATATPSTSGWSFDVTLRHPDSGWDHYADAWAIFSPDGAELGLRELAHPHEAEQPFTRSLSGVNIPDTLDEVVIRARCSVDGWSEHGLTLKLAR